VPVRRESRLQFVRMRGIDGAGGGGGAQGGWNFAGRRDFQRVGQDRTNAAANEGFIAMNGRHEVQRLLELTRRVGNDPLLTQGSTGNSSAKIDGVLWIKASGKWMADALRDDILIPLDLEEVRRCLRDGVDPAVRFPNASLETALHAL